MGVRKARLKDAEAIVKINVRTWKESYRGYFDDSILDGLQVSEDRILHIQKRIQDPNYTVLVYEDKDVLGFMIAGAARVERRIKNELYAIYIQPDVQHKGIGSKLLSRYKQIMKGKSFYLYTLKNNPKSRGFYEKNGGVMCEEFNRSYDFYGQTVEEVCYVFEL